MDRLNLIGKTFGHLKVIKPYPVTDHYGQYWICICECGREVAVRGSNLTTNHTKTCGCRKWKE